MVAASTATTLPLGASKVLLTLRNSMKHAPVSVDTWVAVVVRLSREVDVLKILLLSFRV
jgi:hypothetical protein